MKRLPPQLVTRLRSLTPSASDCREAANLIETLSDSHAWLYGQYERVNQKLRDVREAVASLPADAIRDELLWEIDQGLPREDAIAAATRQGGDVKQAPGEAPQSGHEVASPKTCPGE